MTAAAVAGLLIVGGWYALVTSSSGPREAAALERQIAILEPQSAHLTERRRVSSMATLQDAALTAFGSQGPRVARLLELLSQSTPDEIALTAINVQADGAHWRTIVEGLAVTQDAAAGQGAVNRLLQRLTDSPYVGPAVEPPSFRLIAGATRESPADATRTAAIPDGMSGVEFVMQFRVPK